MEIGELVATLRAQRGDTASVEVKRGEGGYPGGALESLCALANLPGGGTLVIGLDESRGFTPVEISRPEEYLKAVGDQARALEPPAVVSVELTVFEGRTLVVATVRECDPAAKPCRVKASRRAYIRSHDGDYVMSELEEQGFLRLRTAPHVDGHPVPAASSDDLDPDLLGRWAATVRERDPRGLGRFDDDEMPIRAGAVTREGIPTRAGLLALGRHPQQFFPRMVVKVADQRSTDPAERARNARTFTGPIGVMLDETLAWLRLNLGSRTVGFLDGTVREVPVYPLVALRELVANALVHRDLDAWSEGQAVEIRVLPGRLEITNPGGLFGVTVDRLGKVEFTRARNRVLVGLCENVQGPDGVRVVEALASGLVTVSRELDSLGLPPARYYDTGIAFTAVIEQPGVPAPAPTTVGSRLPERGTNLRTVLDAVTNSPGSSITELAQLTTLSRSSVRTALGALRGPDWQLVQAHGGRGRTTTYHRVDAGRDLAAGG